MILMIPQILGTVIKVIFKNEISFSYVYCTCIYVYKQNYRRN